MHQAFSCGRTPLTCLFAIWPCSTPAENLTRAWISWCKEMIYSEMVNNHFFFYDKGGRAFRYHSVVFQNYSSALLLFVIKILMLHFKNVLRINSRLKFWKEYNWVLKNCKYNTITYFYLTRIKFFLSLKRKGSKPATKTSLARVFEHNISAWY